MGRRKTYVGVEPIVCQHIAEGLSLREIAKMEGMPKPSTVMEWVSKDPEFAEQYAQAKAVQMDHMAEEIIEISDDGSNDWMERQDAEGKSLGWQLNGEHVQRSRLRVDARKWVMSKLAPKKYGDRITHEVGETTLAALLSEGSDKAEK